MQKTTASTNISESLPLPLWKKGVVCFNVLFSLGYFIWRAGYTMNPDYPVYSWLFFAVDLLGFGSTLMFIYGSFRLRKRESLPIRSRPS
ncbi:MAG: hypothetical protein HY074_08315, partial [Deltaproteobacteria bacterium]|nr:hypothetical protein [Deltaproteobacteria bacterium]